MRLVTAIAILCVNLVPLKITRAQEAKFKFDEDLKLVSHIRSWCDEQEYIVSLLRAKGTSGHYFVLMNLSKGIIAKFHVESAYVGPDVYFSSTDSEFTIYFKTGVSNVKVLTFFKDGRDPRLQEREDLGQLDKWLIAYTYRDHFYFAAESKEDNTIIRYELVGNEIVSQLKLKADRQITKQLKKADFENINTDTRLALNLRPGDRNSISTPGYSEIELSHRYRNHIFKDSLIIIRSTKSQNIGKSNVNVMKFDFGKGEVSERRLFELNYSSSINCFILGNKLFIIASGANVDKSKTMLYANVSIHDFSTLKLLKEIRLEETSTDLSFKVSPVMNKDEENLEIKNPGIEKALSLLRSENYQCAVYQAESGNYVFNFIENVYTTSSPSPAGQTMISLTDMYSFNACLTSELDWCSGPIEKSPYQRALEHQFNLNRATKPNTRVITPPNYCQNGNSVLVFSYEKEAGELLVTRFH